MPSLSQFRNRVKTIVVAKVSTEFRRAGIVKRIIANAKNEGHISKGNLTNPQRTRSITPFSDDRWLIRKDAVKISVVELPSQQFMVSNITITLRYGVNNKYKALAHYEPKVFVRPSTDVISNWIRNKQQNGTWKGEYVPENRIKSVSFAIARHMKNNGIKKSNFTKPFFDRRTGVRPTLAKAMAKVATRLDSLYAQALQRSVVKIIRL